RLTLYHGRSFGKAGAERRGPEPQRYVSELSPTQLRIMPESVPVDVAIIGGGPGGYIAAIRAAQLGLNTVCVEMDRTLGGTCVNIGCIPSKALLSSSEHYEFAKLHAAEHGVQIADVKLDLATMMKRKDAVVGQNTKGIEYLSR